MTGKSDFTEQEWETVIEGPTSAGLIVSTAERGGTFRESFSMAKAWTDARNAAGPSTLVDEIAQSKPKVDRDGGAGEGMREQLLGNVREAVTLLGAKAAPEELDEYRGFTLAIAERVAGAKSEGDQPVSAAEQQAIEEIRGALGLDAAG